MRVTYLAHSGFLAETEQAYYLFDYIRGELPQMDHAKPLHVFVSHWHPDHFSKKIFGPQIAGNAAVFWISRDVLEHNCTECEEQRERFGNRIRLVGEEKQYTVSGITVTTLHSTDEGVAFIVREERGNTIYHAGDLNWWYWEGEPDPWNPDMEKSYRQVIDRLKGECFDAAFVPLDPRQEDAYWYGLSYFEEQTRTRHIFPMHFWKDYTLADRYLQEHPPKNRCTTIHTIQQEGQSYEI